MPKSTEQVRREYRESMGRVADFAEQHNKSAFFKRLFDHGDLSEREMMDALRLAPEDGAGERAAAAEAYMAKHAKPPQDDRQSREDERAKAERVSTVACVIFATVFSLMAVANVIAVLKP
jgi:hypothetical protein